MSETTPFLRRWAKRKAAAQQATTTSSVETLPPEAIETSNAIIETTETDTPNTPAITEAPTESVTPAPALTDEDMPDINTLDEQSDYSPFFSPEVTDELRKLALRKLFHSPKFHIRDGLDDYDSDYTQFVALGDTITADMKHQLAQEAERQLQQQLNKVTEDLLHETPNTSDTTVTTNTTPSDNSDSPTPNDQQESKA